jgi:hypothetical protein
VALSLNFERVLREGVWVVRAASGLIMLALTVVTALVALWPSRSSALTGAVLAAISAFTLMNLIQLIMRRANRPTPGAGSNLPVRLVVMTGEPALTLAGALISAFGIAVGVYLVAVGSIYGIAMGLYMAWVLLVDIRRLPGEGGAP